MEWISIKYRLLYELDTAKSYDTVEVILTKISSSKKQDVYDAVLSRFQSFNFVSASDYEFYKRKVFYRKTLLELASIEDQEAILQSISYDLQNILESGKSIGLEETLSVLSEYKNILGNVDTSFINSELERIPEGLRIEFGESLKDIENIFDIHFSDFQNIETLKENTLDVIDEGIQDFLDDNIGNLIENFSQ